MKEFQPRQYQALQEMDQNIDKLKFIHRINPNSNAEEHAKRQVWRKYYGATRHISRPNGELKIEVDWEMIDILSGRIK